MKMNKVLSYKGFTGSINFDEDANIYYGEVTNIRDVVTFQSELREELEQAFIDSVEDYIEFLSL